MIMLEKQLEDIIFYANKEALLGRGLYVPTFKVRQMKIPSYGVADIVAIDKHDYYLDMQGNTKSVPVLVVYEIKRENVSVSAFLQAVGYAHGIKEYLLKRNYNLYLNMRIKIVLIGSKIDDYSTFKYLPSLISDQKFQLETYTYFIAETGIKFRAHHNRFL